MTTLHLHDNIEAEFFAELAAVLLKQTPEHRMEQFEVAKQETLEKLASVLTVLTDELQAELSARERLERMTPSERIDELEWTLVP